MSTNYEAKVRGGLAFSIQYSADAEQATRVEGAIHGGDKWFSLPVARSTSASQINPVDALTYLNELVRYSGSRLLSIGRADALGDLRKQISTMWLAKLLVAASVAACGLSPANAQQTPSTPMAEQILKGLAAVAKHGDLADAQFTAKALGTAIVATPVRVEKFGVDRIEYLMDPCPFGSAVTRCAYSVAQRDGEGRVRGRLELQFAVDKLCISSRDITDALGPAGRIIIPVSLRRPDLGVRSSADPYKGVSGVKFDFPGSPNRVSLLVNLLYQPCLQDAEVVQNLD